MSLDGQTPYKLTSSPLLLNLAELILTFLSDTQVDMLACHWMLFRLYSTKQQLFPHPSPTLWDRIKLIKTKYYEKILLFVENYLELRCEIKIELALCSLRYYDYTECHCLLNSVENELCMELNVTGELGKRTKFQIDDKAQLVLMIMKKKDFPELFFHFPIKSYKERIENVPLDDDTLLGYIQVSWNVCYDGSYFVGKSRRFRSNGSLWFLKRNLLTEYFPILTIIASVDSTKISLH